MGSGSWTTDAYTAKEFLRRASGKTTFDYDAGIRSTPRASWKAHDTLNPKGVTVRESRDSDEHPESTSIAVIFDVTGSMAEVPMVLQTKLPGLLGLLLRKGYVEHPQILFGAVGDATCDVVPLQMGQFESDNRMDDHLTNMVLERGGGGQMTESYELAMYFMARHTITDSYEKRGKRGYLFFIGDEMAYSRVKAREVADVIGDGLQQDIILEDIVRELQQKWEVFFILPKAASYGGNPEVLTFWRKLFRQNVLELDDADAVCETIAAAIGIAEGTVDLDDAVSDLVAIGASASVIGATKTALAPYTGGTAVAKSSGGSLTGLSDPKAPPKTERL
jgi:hypothetical protein